LVTFLDFLTENDHVLAASDRSRHETESDDNQFVNRLWNIAFTTVILWYVLNVTRPTATTVNNRKNNNRLFKHKFLQASWHNTSPTLLQLPRELVCKLSPKSYGLVTGLCQTFHDAVGKLQVPGPSRWSVMSVTNSCSKSCHVTLKMPRWDTLSQWLTTRVNLCVLTSCTCIGRVQLKTKCKEQWLNETTRTAQKSGSRCHLNLMRPSLFIVQRYIRDKLFTEMRSLIPETRDRLSGFVQNQTDCQGSYRNLTVVFQTFVWKFLR